MKSIYEYRKNSSNAPKCKYIPQNLMRSKALDLPELSELEVVRHFTNLSKLNFGVDSNFYPLGSCTMQYNAKILEYAAALPGFS